MAAPQSIIEKYVTHLEGWIQRCNTNHSDNCQVDPIAGRLPHHIPDWVVDTEDGCIIRGCSVQRYAALSYVWTPAAKDGGAGGTEAEDRLVLQKDNLPDFCRRGFLRSRVLRRMPVVIQDAINFVQLSGFRYLWVDSLCIVQHEETTRDRVGLMNEIYSGAYFTIIAATSSTGLYGSKNHDDENLSPSYAWMQPARYLHNKLLCSHWASRGWTFQEHLLSKRSIVFLDDVCFWDCEHEVQWPGSSMHEDTDSSVQMDAFCHARQPTSTNYNPFERAALDRVDRKLFSSGESQDSASLSTIPDFGFYIELVCRYNNRDLTYDQDVLPAFSGVLEALLTRGFRGGFICGLPALLLDSALLWQPLLKARRRSPVGTATKIAPLAPLPSWSWAGWQCLVDPNSLRNGLDYMDWEFSDYRRAHSKTREVSWRTWNSVDWSTLSDDLSINAVDEPAVLELFKAAWEEPNHEYPPTVWSRDVTGDFIHARGPTVVDRYPLPIQNTVSATVAERNISLLFCTTKTATLRVRRLLVPYDKVVRSAAKKPTRLRGASALHTSVFKTDIYNFKPQLHTLCPVITLEDKEGRWAGAMKVMDNEVTVQSGSELKMIAISTGSALQRDVAGSYPEMIDSRGQWCTGRSREDYLFRPQGWRDGLDNGGQKRQFSTAMDTQQSLDAGIDLGPFVPRRSPVVPNRGAAVGPTSPAGPDQPERYHFYNVLWVETIEGVMYRKAAGRVPKEVWELNCGEPTEIVLG